jgi:TonB family protein
MRHIYFILVLISFLCKQTYAQDTLFYDKTESEIFLINDAIYYSIKPKTSIDSSNYTIEKYFINGQLYSQHTYDRNTRKKLMTYYESGQLKWDIEYDQRYEKKILVYWPNGKTKRIDSFENGQLMQGICYDSNGKKVPYIDFNIMPEFPGKEDGLMMYLSRSIKHPKAPNGGQNFGRVIIDFIITKEGKVDEVKVRKSVSQELDNEAIRVIQSMPKWKPGLMDGMPVNVSFTLPIMFEREE